MTNKYRLATYISEEIDRGSYKVIDAEGEVYWLQANMFDLSPGQNLHPGDQGRIEYQSTATRGWWQWTTTNSDSPDWIQQTNVYIAEIKHAIRYPGNGGLKATVNRIARELIQETVTETLDLLIGAGLDVAQADEAIEVALQEVAVEARGA